MNLVAAIAALSLLVLIFRMKSVARNTSIRSAWNWAVVAVVLLNAFAICRWGQLGTVMVHSALQYSAAVLCLAPFIDVLGARRPAHQAWPWFVICPMIVVLQWPAISQVAAGITDSPVEIQTPTFIGFLLVVLMGCGNYFGTSNTASALVAAGGIILLALPVSDWVDYDNGWMVPLALVLLVLAISVSQRPMLHGQHAPEAAEDLNRHHDLWNDFCTMYGMVWAKRVVDRVNQFAARESWDVRLSVFGFIQHSANQRPNQLPELAKHVGNRPLVILCWVLRRFLDAEFLINYVPDAVIHKESKPAERSSPNESEPKSTA